MSTASGLLAAYGRLEFFSSLTESARRSSVLTSEEHNEALMELIRLLEPQERASASLDALEFQTLLRSRCSVTNDEFQALRLSATDGVFKSQTAEVLSRISRALAKERSDIAGRISGG